MNIAICTMYSCPLCKFKAVQDIIMKFLKKYKAPWDKMLNTNNVTLVNLLLELQPFKLSRYWK